MPGASHIQKVSAGHEAIIQQILLEPRTTHEELAEMFGYSRTWLTRVIGSDSFQARLAQRRLEMVDPDLRARLNDRVKGAVLQSVDTIQRRLDSTDNAKLALESLGVLSNALELLNPPVKK